MDAETKKMLLFALFTLVVWSVVVVYMVKEKNPDACAPYWDVARSNRGLVALLVSGVVGYFLFMHETPVEPTSFQHQYSFFYCKRCRHGHSSATIKTKYLL